MSLSSWISCCKGEQVAAQKTRRAPHSDNKITRTASEIKPNNMPIVHSAGPPLARRL